jgi:glyoxylase-like metal-dependent hydrolase (beta-lactamase superfamily II)
LGEERGVTRAIELRAGLFLIDLRFQGESGVIAAFLLGNAGEYALVETGPTSTLDALLDGIQAAGVAPEAITKLLVTHIHLDHAGAAGTLVKLFPHLQVYVHEVGAPHLADPSKLLASAQRIYGDRMDALWGEVLAVPSANIVALSDRDSVRIGHAELTALYTPGHASHHVAYLDTEQREVFTGDVAAIRLQGFDYVRPATPPPDIDLELWTASLDRLRGVHADTLHLTHFGSFSDVNRHLMTAQDQLFAWATFIENLQDQGREPLEIKSALRDRADAEVLAVHPDKEAVRRYELAAPSGMSVDGYLRYFRRRDRDH